MRGHPSFSIVFQYPSLITMATGRLCQQALLWFIVLYVLFLFLTLFFFSSPLNVEYVIKWPVTRAEVTLEWMAFSKR